MTETEKNNKLAEAAGWTHLEREEIGMMLSPNWVGYPPSAPIIGEKDKIPWFLNDTNALRDVYRKLNYSQKEKYITILCKIVLDKCDLDFNEFKYMLAEISMCHPSYQVEALRRTLNLWI